MTSVKWGLRPRGRKTAYIFFAEAAREEQKRLPTDPDKKFVFADFARSCGEKWKALNEDERKPFKILSEQDKVRFDKQTQAFPATATKKKRTKDPNAPKRPLTDFLWFCKDVRPQVKGQNPEYGIGEAAKELGKRWGEASPDVRQKYQDMFTADRSRYQREMNLYKARGAAPPTHHAPDDDDDEEESDED